MAAGALSACDLGEGSDTHASQGDGAQEAQEDPIARLLLEGGHDVIIADKDGKDQAKDDDGKAAASSKAKVKVKVKSKGAKSKKDDDPKADDVDYAGGSQADKYGNLNDFVSQKNGKSMSIFESNIDIILKKQKDDVFWRDAPTDDGYPPAFSYNQPELTVRMKSNHIKGGPAIPKRYEKPANVVESLRLPTAAAECIVGQLSKKFRLPSNFYNTMDYDDGAKTVSLYNPYSKNAGLYFDIEPTSYGSTIRLYANRAVMSMAWIRLPESCK